MTTPFSVRTTPHFEGLPRRLVNGHPDLTERYAEALRILGLDVHNRSRRYAIKKAHGCGSRREAVSAAAGPLALPLRYLRAGVVLHYCGLRREDT